MSPRPRKPRTATVQAEVPAQILSVKDQIDPTVELITRLRKVPVDDLDQILAQAKILSGWKTGAFGSTEFLYRYPETVVPVAFVRQNLRTMRWEITILSQKDTSGDYLTKEEAKRKTEGILKSEHQYV
jgi:hypothetical protein